jgi:hypothetical protein
VGSQVWWCTPVVPAVRRLRQEDRVQGQPGILSESLSQN